MAPPVKTPEPPSASCTVTLGHDMNLEGPLCRGGDPSLLLTGQESL